MPNYFSFPIPNFSPVGVFSQISARDIYKNRSILRYLIVPIHLRTLKLVQPHRLNNDGITVILSDTDFVLINREQPNPECLFTYSEKQFPIHATVTPPDCY